MIKWKPRYKPSNNNAKLYDLIPLGGVFMVVDVFYCPEYPVSNYALVTALFEERTVSFPLKDKLSPRENFRVMEES